MWGCRASPFHFVVVGGVTNSVNWLTPDWWLMAVPRLEASKDCNMKKKLLVLLVAVIPTLIPNMASAVAIDVNICFGFETHPFWCY
jgi:putative flippase GtrA